MPAFTLIVPYYRNMKMLARQLEEFERYPPKGMAIIVVDDGSPEPARAILDFASESLRKLLTLYRITVDIPWNREGARNLAALKASTDWLVQVDIDHILPAAACERLIDFDASDDFWYRFPRWRQGRADETRQKDKIGRDVAFGQIHEHIDSYLMTRDAYLALGGYDEDFAGCLGGGTDFLKRAEHKYGAPLLLPADMHLHVYTRDRISDASDWSLSRDREKGKRLARMKPTLRPPPARPVRFPWVREL